MTPEELLRLSDEISTYGKYKWPKALLSADELKLLAFAEGYLALSAKLQEAERALALFQKKAHDWWAEADRYLAQRDELTLNLQEAEKVVEARRKLTAALEIAHAQAVQERDAAWNKMQEAQAERDMGHQRLNETRAERVKGTLYDRISWLIELLSSEVAEHRNMREATNAHQASLEAQLKEAEGLRLAAEYRARQLELERDEKAAIIKAVGHELDELRARAESAKARQAAAEHRAQRVLLEIEASRGEVVKACPSCGNHQLGAQRHREGPTPWWCSACDAEYDEPALWQRVEKGPR